MVTYGCPREEKTDLAAKLRRIIAATGIPARVVVHRDAGVGIALTVRGRGKRAERVRSEARMALWDAQAILGLRSAGVFASTCGACGATSFGHAHTPALCAALIDLAAELDVALTIHLAVCPECGRRFLPVRPDERILAGLCKRCYAAEIAALRAVAAE